MCKSLTVLAPAKINLGLKVFPKRADGYHDIASIFTTVSLCDTIKVDLCDGIGEKNCCTVDCDGMILPEDNTLTKAYKAFCVLTGNDRGVHVKVEKKIPAGGGLGGGSSDSSSFIKSIDSLLGTRLNDSDLDKISSQVGSDVFFFTKAQYAFEDDAEFLSSRFAALVTGRGEKIVPIKPRNDFSVLLVFPGVSVSTPVAYALVDSAFETGLINRDAGGLSLESIFQSSVRDWTFCNDFTKAVVETYPQVGYSIGVAIESLKKLGADFVDMSGSGSTVFGVFEDKDRALFAQSKFGLFTEQQFGKSFQTVLV